MFAVSSAPASSATSLLEAAQMPLLTRVVSSSCRDESGVLVAVVGDSIAITILLVRVLVVVQVRAIWRREPVLLAPVRRGPQKYTGPTEYRGKFCLFFLSTWHFSFLSIPISVFIFCSPSFFSFFSCVFFRISSCSSSSVSLHTIPSFYSLRNGCDIDSLSVWCRLSVVSVFRLPRSTLDTDWYYCMYVQNVCVASATSRHDSLWLFRYLLYPI